MTEIVSKKGIPGEQSQESKQANSKNATILPLDSKFPSTRYAGSKRRLLPMLYEVFKELEFKLAIDVFSGTASVAYLLKKMGKKVIANDYLWSNYWTAIALIENDSLTLSEAEIAFILDESSDKFAPNFISETFSGFYFTDNENAWLDNCVNNILKLGELSTDGIMYKQAIAYHSLFQSALRKRPFNMFHRRNLNLRLASVKREFGNATTWARPFTDHFREIVKEVNSLVLDNGFHHKVYRENVLTWKTAPDSDLVYIDPPYVWLGASEAEVDYLVKYHFLEGLARYQEWSDLIDRKSPILQIRDGYTPWPVDTRREYRALHEAFAQMVEIFKDRIMVFSYREPGIPSISEISGLLKKYKRHVYVIKSPYWYVLRKPSKSESAAPNEVVIVGTDDEYRGFSHEVR